MGEQIVDSKISKVTVYRSGALVTRVAVLGEIGQEALRLVGLPLSLEDSTVSCRLMGGEEAATEKGQEAPVSSDFKVVLDAPGLLEKEVRAEAEELKKLRLQIRQLRARARVLRQGLDFEMQLGSRAPGENGSAPVAPPLEARLALLEFSDKHHLSLYEEHHAAQEKIESAQRRLEELEAAEQRASSVGRSDKNRLSKSVKVHIQGSSGSSDLRLELQYFVPGARWAPAYALRVQPGLKSAELTMRAMVAQRSGEDWSGIELTLSTAEVQRWAEIPELKSKRIGRRQNEAPKRGFCPPPTGSNELYRDYDNSFGAPVHPPTIGAGGVPEPVLFGASGRAVSAAYEDHETAVSFSSFDEEEHTEEIFESSLPPAPAAASAPPAPMAPAKLRKRSAPRGGRSKESAEEMPPEVLWDDGYGGGGEMAMEDPAPPVEMQVEPGEQLLHYARLRMCAATSLERGTLHFSSGTKIYLEALEEQGIKVDDEVRERLLLHAELARTSAMEIAALPTDHSLAWAEDYDYAYRAQSQLDLHSDGQFHSVPIMLTEASCKAKHVVVPRESTDVFRTLKMTNTFASPLLPGPMDVYWNENFLLTTQVSLTAPSGEVELGLGVDQAVKVVRNTNFREDTAGLMGGALQLTHKIAIEVANTSERAIELQVQERIPVASSDADDIKVLIKSTSPDWSKFEPEPESAHMDALQGGYQWELAIAAGERAELSASYEIRLPSKYELRGGNRREW